MARDTKLGPEEITRDIPNVGEDALRNLDEAGHRLHRRRGHAGRHPGRQDHAEGRDADDAGGEAAAGDLRREGLRRARHEPAACRRGTRARWSRSASSTATASRRTSARWPDRARVEIEQLAKRPRRRDSRSSTAISMRG